MLLLDKIVLVFSFQFNYLIFSISIHNLRLSILAETAAATADG